MRLGVKGYGVAKLLVPQIYISHRVLSEEGNTERFSSRPAACFRSPPTSAIITAACKDLVCEFPLCVFLSHNHCMREMSPGCQLVGPPVGLMGP